MLNKYKREITNEVKTWNMGKQIKHYPSKGSFVQDLFSVK